MVAISVALCVDLDFALLVGFFDDDVPLPAAYRRGYYDSVLFGGNSFHVLEVRADLQRAVVVSVQERFFDGGADAGLRRFVPFCVCWSARVIVGATAIRETASSIIASVYRRF